MALAPIIGALTSYFQDTLSVVVWPEEVPRYDTAGNPINPQATGKDPSIWPVVQILMNGGFTRANTFTNAYSDDNSQFKIKSWGTTKPEVDDQMGIIHDALVKPETWFWYNSPIGQLLPRPFSIYDLEVGRWESVQDALVRLGDSKLCWTAEMDMKLKIHGS